MLGALVALGLGASLLVARKPLGECTASLGACADYLTSEDGALPLFVMASAALLLTAGILLIRHRP